jgi:hypothetical protein
MKKIIFTLALLAIITSQSFSQTFTLPYEIGQGFKFINYQNPQYYMLTTTVKPSIQVVNDKLILSSIVMTTFTDGVTDVFAGTGANYKVFEKGESFDLQIGSTALFNAEKQLYGINIITEFDNLFYITLNARQEYSQKEFWFDAGVGIKLVK